MDDAKGLWSEWQSLLAQFRGVFTLGGWARFAQWATGTVLCSEEHTITQILTGLGLETQWRNVEHFAEYGSPSRRGLVSTTALEPEKTSRVDPRHAPAVLETSPEVFASPSRPERVAKTSPNQISLRPANLPGRIKC